MIVFNETILIFLMNLVQKSMFFRRFLGKFTILLLSAFWDAPLVSRGGTYELDNNRVSYLSKYRWFIYFFQLFDGFVRVWKVDSLYSDVLSQRVRHIHHISSLNRDGIEMIIKFSISIWFWSRIRLKSGSRVFKS